MKKGIVSRVLWCVASAFAKLIELVWALLGVCGGAAVGYGWANSGSLEQGIKYFESEFVKLFPANSANLILKAIGSAFNDYFKALESYPWLHLTVIFVGIILLVKGRRSAKRLGESVSALVNEAKGTTPVEMPKAQAHAIAKKPVETNRKAAVLPKRIEIVNTTGMPSVLKRHANWGLATKEEGL